MASDNHAHYSRIGFLVMAGLLAITATLVYLGGVRGRNSEVFVETYSEKPVSGLSVGSTVNFRGVKIGEVRKISFVGSHYNVRGVANSQIYILMAFKRSLLGLDDENDDDELREVLDNVIKKGVRATVTASGITGLSKIELDYPGPDAPPPQKISWEPEHPYIPLAPSLIDNFADTATHVLSEIDKLDFAALRNNIHATMDNSVNAVSNISELAAASASLVNAERVKLDEILEEFRLAAASIRQFADRIADDPSLLVIPPKGEPLPETR